MSFLSTLPTLLAAAPQAHEPQLIDVDGTIFIQLGFFLLLVVVLQRFLWKPYLRVREERVTRIEGYRLEAARLEADADARLARAEAQLAEARRVGIGERAVARAEAQAREQALLAEAQAAAQKTLAGARAQLDGMLVAERAKLQQRASEIGREAAKKILGREVST
jgi:F-type H+-transporting ATPase subunit b